MGATSEERAVLQKLDVNDEQSALEKIAAQRGNNHLAEAEQLATEALIRWPDSVPLLLARGALRATLDRYDGALVDFQEVLKRDGLSENALLFKARVLRLQQRFKAAAESLEEALQRLPGKALLLEERDALFDDLILTITSLRLNGRTEQARDLRTDALATLPLAQRGIVLFGLGDHAEALEMLRATDEDEAALTIKAVILRQQGEFDTAEQVLSEGLERRPESVELLTERAALLFDREQYIPALDVLNCCAPV